MSVQLTIKNYRCFVSPITIDLGKGFTAFVGVNNAGKSTIMRFLLEMRNLLEVIGHDQNLLLHAINHPSGTPSFNLQHVLDREEIFSNLNSQALQFWFEFSANDAPLNVSVTKAIFTVQRDLRWTCELEVAGKLLLRRGASLMDNQLIVQDKVIANFTRLVEIAQTLAKTIYVGPFRNTINVGTKTDYLDIQIGESFIQQFRNLKTGISKQASTEIQALTEKI
jgi:predicted ATP-dependent endonuclease of OLD family